MREGEAQGLDGRDDSLWKKKDSRLISQCVILLHCCLYTIISHLFFALFLSLTPFFTLLTRSFSFLSRILTSRCLSFLFYYSTVFPIHLTRLFNLYVLFFSLNALFFLTSCVHPFEWPCVTPGRIITVGRSISSVAPYSALSACIIHLWSIPFCGEPSSYSPVMIGVLATLCICTVI